MHSARLLATAAILASGAGIARAEPVLVWHCWYDADGRFQLTCELPDPALVQQPTEDGDIAEAVRAQWRRALHSNEFGLAARLVRGHPVAFAARRVYIPLYGPPEQDMIQAERLARAAMCARRPACVVAFDRRVLPDPAD